jgi:ABC-type sugar transport system ATPase subunit
MGPGPLHREHHPGVHVPTPTASSAATVAPNASAADATALALIGIRKEYPGTIAVDFGADTRLEFRRGEIHALVGENGAGKSTLVSVIAGVQAPSAGTMVLEGRPHQPRDAVEARRNGVDIVLQEPGLIETMSVEENLLLGRESLYAPWGFFMPSARRRPAQAALDHIRRPIPLEKRAGDLNLEDQKFVELARALSQAPKVLVIDEMTASLSEQGVPALFEILRAFAKAGGTVIYISHYLEEVAALCDRVTVMKDGAIVRTLDARTTTEDELSVLMVGRSVLSSMYRSDEAARTTGEVVLEARGLTVRDRFRDLDLTLHAGEIVGVAGLIGCGSETLALTLFGDVRPDAGGIRLHGRPFAPRDPGEAIAAGVALVPGDREREGLILNLAIERNIGLPSVPWLATYGVIGPRVERRIASRLMDEVRIVARGPGVVPYSLSGGNRQKVVLSKWLVRYCRALILHNPTRGVDIAGRAEIYGVIRQLADRGVAVLLVSDDLPELLGLSDTLLVMRRGAVSAVMSRDQQPTEESVIGFML